MKSEFVFVSSPHKAGGDTALEITSPGGRLVFAVTPARSAGCSPKPQLGQGCSAPKQLQKQNFCVGQREAEPGSCLEDRSTRHMSGEWIHPQLPGDTSRATRLPRAEFYQLPAPRKTHPTWDGRDGERKEQCPCQGGFLGMQVPGLRGMKLLMK